MEIIEQPLQFHSFLKEFCQRDSIGKSDLYAAMKLLHSWGDTLFIWRWNLAHTYLEKNNLPKDDQSVRQVILEYLSAAV